MKKVFISQPMRGKTDEEILKEREKLANVAKAYAGEDVEVLDTFFKDFNGNALEYLGKSISMLAQADFAVFGEGCTGARGCRVEYEACVQYGIPVMFIHKM